MRFFKYISLTALLFANTILSGNKIFAQAGKAEHNYLKAKIGEWLVVMTFRPSADATPRIINGLAAERITLH